MSKILTGTVVSNAMTKSAVVAVVSSKIHPLYKKRYSSTKRFIVHDEHNTAQIGDVVELIAIRPLSAHKHFSIQKTITKAPVVDKLKDEPVKGATK